MLNEAESTQGAALRSGAIMRTGFAVTLYVRQMRPVYRTETIRCRRYMLERFVQQIGDPALKAIKPRTVSDWLNQQTGFGPAAYRSALSHVRAFFKWCVQEGHLKADPTVVLRGPKQPRTVPRSLGSTELEALTDALPDARARLVVALMLDMGLRRAEVARLDMADLDLRSEVARIEGKGGHQRVLPITPMVRTMLGVYLNERGPGPGPVIRALTHPGGIRPETLGKLVSQWMTEAGFHQPGDGRTGHALRHTMATNMRRHGVELENIQAALGHVRLSTTEIYLKPEDSVENLRTVMGRPFIDQRPPTLRPVHDAAG